MARSKLSKQLASGYFYNVYVEETDDETNTIKFRELVATFKTFKEADYFVTNNVTDINETCFDIAKIYKLKYGAHYSFSSEISVYKFDRITMQYYLTQVITKETA